MRDKVFLAFLWFFAAPASAEPVVIAALGDSLTQGYGLPAKQGFIPQLEGWLNAQGAEVRLINAGVSGDTSAGGLARIGWTLEPEVDGLIVALGSNDFLRGIDPANTRVNLQAIVQAAIAADVQVLLVGAQAPGNYGPDYKQSFDAIYPDLAKEYDLLFAQSFFTGLGTLDDPATQRAYFQADGLHPNAAGVSKIVAAFGPNVLSLIERIEQK